MLREDREGTSFAQLEYLKNDPSTLLMLYSSWVGNYWTQTERNHECAMNASLTIESIPMLVPLEEGYRLTGKSELLADSEGAAEASQRGVLDY